MGLEKTEIEVQLSGLSDIMFDRFIDHSKEQRPPEQKLYLAGDNEVVLPAENIIAFISGENPQGCARSFEGKKGKEYIRTALGHIFVDPMVIPFHHNGKPLIYETFDKGPLWVHWGSGRTKSGSVSIKQEIKPRPVLKLPWTMRP